MHETTCYDSVGLFVDGPLNVIKGGSLRRLRVFVAVCVALLALAPTASAHLITVKPAGQGNGTVQWVGGGGAAHGTGLVHACLVAMGNESGVVTFMAPPFPPFTPTIPEHCIHGHGEHH